MQTQQAQTEPSATRLVGDLPTAIHCVPPGAIVEAWPRLKSMVKSFVQRADLYEPEHVRDWLTSGAMQLWLAGTRALGIEAIAVTETIQHPKAKTMTIHGCYGKNEQRWLGHIAAIEGEARKQGCRTVRVEGRIGWARKLPDYKLVGYILEKTL